MERKSNLWATQRWDGESVKACNDFQSANKNAKMTFTWSSLAYDKIHRNEKKSDFASFLVSPFRIINESVSFRLQKLEWFLRIDKFTQPI